MQAGRLRHVITIQQPSEEQDTAGQMSTAYVNLHEGIRAEIVPLSGREYVAARQVNASVTTRITIRKYRDVEPACRVLREIGCDTPEVYDVVAVLPDNKSGEQWLTLMCEQVFSEGFRRGD